MAVIEARALRKSFGTTAALDGVDLRVEEGLAQLASAEQNYAVGDYGAALNFAERARRTLDRGTPSFQRASDIATFSGEEMRERGGRQQGGRRG